MRESLFELPKIVYHGTFWVRGKGIGPEGLRTDYGYVSTTPNKRLAQWYAFYRRWDNRKKSGKVTVYTIDTGKLPREVLEGCLPPDIVDPRMEYDQLEEEMQKDRILMQDWRFPYIPTNAILAVEEEYKKAEPDLSLFYVISSRPD